MPFEPPLRAPDERLGAERFAPPRPADFRLPPDLAVAFLPPRLALLFFPPLDLAALRTPVFFPPDLLFDPPDFALLPPERAPPAEAELLLRVPDDPVEVPAPKRLAPEAPPLGVVPLALRAADEDPDPPEKAPVRPGWDPVLPVVAPGAERL